MLHGFFGSGKSTWAKKFVEKHPNTKIVNMDAIRYMLNGKRVYIIADDKVVLKIARTAILELLSCGHDVIIDCGNLTRLVRESWTNYQLSDVKVILVEFPRKSLNWHVNNRMNDPKGQNRKYWEEYYNLQWNQYQEPNEDEYDERIEIKEQEIEQI